MSALVEFVSKKPLPKHTRHLLVEVMVSDEDGEDVEVNIQNLLDHLTTLTIKRTCY
jgi:Ubiquitin fold domain